MANGMLVCNPDFTSILTCSFNVTFTLWICTKSQITQHHIYQLQFMKLTHLEFMRKRSFAEIHLPTFIYVAFFAPVFFINTRFSGLIYQNRTVSCNVWYRLCPTYSKKCSLQLFHFHLKESINCLQAGICISDLPYFLCEWKG